MAFVFENIPEADRKKYNIVDGNFFYQTATTRWTVDRQREIFLLPRTGQGPESIPGQTNWAFYWCGHLLDVLLLSIDTHVDESFGHVLSHKRVLRIDPMTPELEAQRPQIIADLRDALTADRIFGLVRNDQSFEVILDVE